MKLEIFLTLLSATINARRGGGSRGGGSRGSYGGSKSSWGSSSSGSRGTSSWSKPTTGWSSGKPSYGSNTFKNKQYYGGSSSWSKPAYKPSFNSMSANPKYGSLKSGYKSKSSLSSAKNIALLAGGSYIGYKLGKAVGGFGMGGGWGGYGMGSYYGYNYGPYYGYGGGYSPYYSQPNYFYGSSYNRFAYKTQACYSCSSIDGSDSKCENMDDDYTWDELDGFRTVCPVESQCIVTIGRIWPTVDEEPPAITNETSKEDAEAKMKKFEGKNFVKRDCIARNKLNQEGCKSFPSKTVSDKLGFEFDKDKGEVYQCNICDTESCNSWGSRSMPDARYNNSKIIKNCLLLLLFSILV